MEINSLGFLEKKIGIFQESQLKEWEYANPNIYMHTLILLYDKLMVV